MFIVGLVVVAVFSLLIGIVLGALCIKVNSANDANVKITLLSKLIADMSNTYSKTLSDLSVDYSKAMNAMVLSSDAQTKLCNSLRKEKVLLQTQLNEATEHISQLEAMIEDATDEGEDTDDSEDHIVQNKHTKSSFASNKLETIKKLLEDSSRKGEQINPENLLGIVNFKDGGSI